MTEDELQTRRAAFKARFDAMTPEQRDRGMANVFRAIEDIRIEEEAEAEMARLDAMTQEERDAEMERLYPGGRAKFDEAVARVIAKLRALAKEAAAFQAMAERGEIVCAEPGPRQEFSPIPLIGEAPTASEMVVEGRK